MYHLIYYIEIGGYIFTSTEILGFYNSSAVQTHQMIILTIFNPLLF